MPTDTNAPPRTSASHYEFGPYRLEVASRSLFRNGEFVALTPKAAETLLLLVQARGLIVTKEQLLERVWPGVVVEEGGIANNVSALRKILKADFGEDGGIATVSRQGYRFTGEVREGSGMQPSARAAGTPSPPAQPIVKETRNRETILVGDIENKTGDAVFDGTIRQALALVLAQSPFLEILSDRKVHSALGVMQRQGEPVTEDVALEVCQRTNTKAAITGSIFAMGDDYVIGLYAKRGDNGDTLVSEQARARGKNDVLRALDQAALALRAKLGESLASLRRYSSGLADVASGSLDALKSYSLGRETWLSRGETAAIPHFTRALELDPQFVSAHSALGLIYSNLGQMAKAAESMTRAFEYSDRLAENERQRVTAIYHETVTGDAYKAIDAHRACMRINPRDSSAANNCGNARMILGLFAEAEADLRAAKEIEHTGVINTNLTLTLMSLGRVDEARELVESAFALGYDSYFHHSDAYHLAFLRGDEATMRRHFDAVIGRAGEEDYLIAAAASTEAFHGRHERARELSRRAAASALKAGSAEMAATWLADAALREAVVGNAAEARKLVAEAMATDEGRNPLCLAMVASGLLGDGERTGAIASRLAAALPGSTLVNRYWIPSARCALATAQGDWKRALVEIEPADQLDYAMPQPFANPLLLPPYVRGLAYFAGSQWKEAAREFGKIASRPALARNSILFPASRDLEAKAKSML